MRLGIISDTHGLLRPEVFEAFEGVDHILHGGDIGPLGHPGRAGGDRAGDGGVRQHRRLGCPNPPAAGRTGSSSTASTIVVTHGDQFGTPTPDELQAAFPDGGDHRLRPHPPAGAHAGGCGGDGDESRGRRRRGGSSSHPRWASSSWSRAYRLAAGWFRSRRSTTRDRVCSPLSRSCSRRRRSSGARSAASIVASADPGRLDRASGSAVGAIRPGKAWRSIWLLRAADSAFVVARMPDGAVSGAMIWSSASTSSGDGGAFPGHDDFQWYFRRTLDSSVIYRGRGGRWEAPRGDPDWRLGAAREGGGWTVGQATPRGWSLVLRLDRAWLAGESGRRPAIAFRVTTTVPAAGSPGQPAAAGDGVERSPDRWGVESEGRRPEVRSPLRCPLCHRGRVAVPALKASCASSWCSRSMPVASWASNFPM